MSDVSLTEEPTFCAVHPDRETGLRCNLCGRYMCAQCAVSTPVGYRCRECVRQVENKFFTGTSTDSIVAFVLPAVITGVAAFILSRINFFGILIAFFAGVIYGGALSQLLLNALKKRRGRYTGYIAAAGIVVGTAAGLILTGLSMGIPFEFVVRRFLMDIGVWIFAGVTAFIVYGRFR